MAQSLVQAVHESVRSNQTKLLREENEETWLGAFAGRRIVQ